MSDVDSDISSPDWKPCDDMDDDDSIDVSQFQDKMESQQHKNEGNKSFDFTTS